MLQYSNTDHAEEFKVRCLVAFSESVQGVAMPFTKGTSKGKNVLSMFSKHSFNWFADKTLPIEKWPLVQAYALEDYGQ